jgi:hypothetical protein
MADVWMIKEMQNHIWVDGGGETTQALTWQKVC